MLDNLVQKSLEHSTEKPGDYMKDGVLCCGVCGKPKQKKIHFPNMGDIRANIGLDSVDKHNIDERAADLARRDLAANRIAASALGVAIEKYAQELSEKRKDEKAAAQMFNSILRGQL